MLKNPAQIELAKMRAKANNDIRELLKPWFTFRLYVRFKKAYIDKRSGDRKNAGHFYGDEHSCSYNQCLHGHAKEIVMDKLKGYNNCVRLAEEVYRGQYQYAAIYARSVFPGGEFHIKHRYYNSKGELEDQQDPVILEEDNRVLYYNIQNHFLEITEVSQSIIPFAEIVKAEFNS